MFYQPRSIEEAIHHKAELQKQGVFIAGGTDLVVLMNQGKTAAENMIDLSHVKALARVRNNGRNLELGGSVTFARCAQLPIRCLSLASLSVGGPGIRELGTLAGNLATASPAGDGSTALLALDCEIELRSNRGARRLPLAGFFRSYRRTVLGDDELITRIFIPRTYKSDWAKVGKRGAMNISIVAAAVALTPGRKVRLALASVAPTPIRCSPAEEFLARNGLSLDAIRQATQIVREEIKPISDHRGSADYKIHLSGVLVRRLLEGLAAQ